MATSVLIVEDEPAIAESVAYFLEREGFAASIALNLAEARRLIDGCQLVVLDLMLPDGSGQHFIVEQRERGRATPIIVLSSRDGETDRVAALDAGADDYINKPFSPREVTARIRAVLRRLGRPRPRVGSHLQLDQATRIARCGERRLQLTRVEFELLTALTSQPGHVYTRAQLIEIVWGSGFAITDRTVDSHIKALRQKLAKAADRAHLIETVRGVGYRIQMAES